MSDVVVSNQHANRPPPIALGINIEKPKFPQYAVFTKRLESFEKWPEYLPVTKEQLVEAGLVYTGVGDSVRCFYCGGGLRNWEAGDVPMEEHTKWYPMCPHIRLVKGQKYIDRVLAGEKPEEDGFMVQTDSAVSNSIHLETIAAQSCIEMGFSDDMVKKAIDMFISRNSSVDFKARDLAEIVFELEETEETVPDVADCPEATAEDPDDLDEEEQTAEQLESLREENQKLKENQMCKICLDKRADVIFLPCGHMMSCAQCAPALTKCPICRKPVNGHVKAFFAVSATS